MRINVQMPDGSKTGFDCSQTDRVESLKEKIELQTGVPRPQQLLTFGGRWLCDPETVEECKLPPWPTLDLIIRPLRCLPILAHCRDLIPLTLFAQLTDRVSDVMRRVENEWRVPRGYFRLWGGY
jgi:hypothetical protein